MIVKSFAYDLANPEQTLITWRLIVVTEDGCEFTLTENDEELHIAVDSQLVVKPLAANRVALKGSRL